jgi:hypothetical protein
MRLRVREHLVHARGKPDVWGRVGSVTYLPLLARRTLFPGPVNP